MKKLLKEFERAHELSITWRTWRDLHDMAGKYDRARYAEKQMIEWIYKADDLRKKILDEKANS